jgi:hypothetical protein
MAFEESAMPSTRKHPRHSHGDALVADDHMMACGQLANRGACAERGDFIDQTIDIWQKRTDRRLTREDGREIIENVTGFFAILQEWERKERTAGDVKTALSAPSPHVERRARRNREEAKNRVSSKPVEAKI